MLTEELYQCGLVRVLISFLIPFTGNVSFSLFPIIVIMFSLLVRQGSFIY